MKQFLLMHIILAWRNIWRNKRRTLITMASIVFAVILAILLNSVKEGVLVKMQENAVNFHTGAIQVQDTNYWEEKTLEHSFIPKADLVKPLEQHKHISGTTRRLETYALAASEEYSKASLIMGIEPSTEPLITKLDKRMVSGEYLTKDDEAVLLSDGLAKYLQLDVNDTLVLIGQGYHGISAAGKYPVKGLVKSGSPELNKRLVYMPLQLAQYLFGAEDRVTSVIIQPTEVSLSVKLAAELSDHFQTNRVMSWQKMLPELDQMIEAERAESVIFLFVLYLLISFGIFGTILMMLMERQFEFGTLVAIGMQKKLLSFVVVLENIFISLLGALVGICLSIPVVMYFHFNPIEVGGELKEVYENFGFEPIFNFSIDPNIFYSQTIIVVIIALILSLYPIIKMMSLDPVTAMRN